MGKSSRLSVNPPQYAVGFPQQFPRLGQRYQRKSCPTDQYNCIAWAMSECHRPWWPGSAPEGYWPPDLPPDETIDNFVAAFEKKGYRPCVGMHYEWRFEKVVLYADRFGIPTHAARLTLLGIWISKLGSNVDIAHKSPDLLHGPLYGSVVHVLKRSWTPKRLAAAFILRTKTSRMVTRWFGLRCE